MNGMLRIMVLAPLLALEAPTADASVVRLEGRGIPLEFDERLRSRVVATSGGAEVVAGPFSASEALGTEAGEVAECLATSHNLALAEIAESLAPRAANVHFEDHLEGDRIAFDYRLKPGPVRKGDALALMRAVGLEV